MSVYNVRCELKVAIFVFVVLHTFCALGRADLRGACAETFRKLGLYCTGAACEVETTALRQWTLFQVFRGVYSDQRPPPTARGFFGYADLAGLYTYDFRNKQVLDIASGGSRFGQLINLFYGHTGTRVISTDILAVRPLVPVLYPFVQANAKQLPFASKHFDLTLNNWMLPYFMRKTFAKAERGQQEKTALQEFILEQLRVTADGGSARLGLGVTVFRTKNHESLKLIQFLLENHPRVESFEFVRHFPLGFSIQVKMKGETSNDTVKLALPSESQLAKQSVKPARWKGLALLQILGLGLAGGGVGYLWQSWTGDSVGDVLEEREETEKAIKNVHPDFAKIHLQLKTKKPDKELLTATRKLLEKLRLEYENTPKDKLRRPFIIQVSPNIDLTERNNFHPSIIWLDPFQPEASMKQLRKKAEE